ncbi:hypothetical protein PMIN01_04324 [Paraphaeosphaeria minitans]|uniref:Uncharacterized protein n=1 Tax=Paraphaeosphaeria minitans TaxID=565426 RepID=A0A9P6GKB5_9PLEO|nr:hypothetical protein PMIN01_04324 [Paraphaeosphaeria minitans]
MGIAESTCSAQCGRWVNGLATVDVFQQRQADGEGARRHEQRGKSNAKRTGKARDGTNRKERATRTAEKGRESRRASRLKGQVELVDLGNVPEGGLAMRCFARKGGGRAAACLQERGPPHGTRRMHLIRYSYDIWIDIYQRGQPAIDTPPTPTSLFPA